MAARLSTSPAEPDVTPATDQSPPNLVRLILILALAPTIGLGIGRFAYSLVLPDMRDSLQWSYSAAGFMNTINAAGYLGGALVAARLADRYGLLALVKAGTLMAIVSLALCAVSANFVVLSSGRLLAGFGAALSFVAGGALAATLAQTQPARSGFLLSLFYAGPGIGILASGLIAPFLLFEFGAGSWWIVWLAMTAISLLMVLPLLPVRIAATTVLAQGDTARFRAAPVVLYLLGYFMFGVGYIAYMTFMIAYVRDAGGGAAAQSAFWSLIGVSAFASPWVWRNVLARKPHRRRDRGYPRLQRARRGPAAAWHLATLARYLGAGVRRRLLRGGRLDDGFRACELSAGDMAERHRGDDDRLRGRPDARPDRDRRDHRRHRQPEFGSVGLGRDAGARWRCSLGHRGR